MFKNPWYISSKTRIFADMEVVKKIFEKKMGKSIKYKNGNYTVEKYTMDRKSNIASVEIGCWCNINSDVKSIGAVLRHLNTLGGVEISFLRKWGLKSLIFIPSVSDNLVDDTVKRSWCSFLLQFEMEDKLSGKLDEGIFDLVEECLMDVIENSDLTVVGRNR